MSDKAVSNRIRQYFNLTYSYHISQTTTNDGSFYSSFPVPTSVLVVVAHWTVAHLLLVHLYK